MPLIAPTKTPHVMLSKGSISGVSALDIVLTPWAGQFKSFRLILRNIRVSVSAILGARFSVDGGSTFLSTSYLQSSGSGTSITVTSNLSASADVRTGFDMEIFGAEDAAVDPSIFSQQFGYGESSSGFAPWPIEAMVQAKHTTAQSINAVRLFLASGTFTSCDFTLVGVR